MRWHLCFYAGDFRKPESNSPTPRICAWILCAGIALGYIYHFQREFFERWLSPWWMLPLAATFLAPLFLTPNYHFLSNMGITTSMIGFTALTAWAVTHQATGHIASFLARIGVYSDSIYLWHACFYHFTAGAFPDSLLTFALGILSALAMGYVMSELVEMPVLRWRDRLVPSGPTSSKRAETAWLPRPHALPEEST